MGCPSSVGRRPQCLAVANGPDCRAHPHAPRPPQASARLSWTGGSAQHLGLRPEATVSKRPSRHPVEPAPRPCVACVLCLSASRSHLKDAETQWPVFTCSRPAGPRPRVGSSHTQPACPRAGPRPCHPACPAAPAMLPPEPRGRHPVLPIGLPHSATGTGLEGTSPLQRRRRDAHSQGAGWAVGGALGSWFWLRV